MIILDNNTNIVLFSIKSIIPNELFSPISQSLIQKIRTETYKKNLC